MSDFDKKSLSNLERLSRIKLTKEEEDDFLIQLKKVIDYVELLDEVDTEGVAPCHSVLTDMQKNVFREDVVKNLLSRDEFLSQAPEVIAGMVKVPTIIDQKE